MSTPNFDANNSVYNHPIIRSNESASKTYRKQEENPSFNRSISDAREGDSNNPIILDIENYSISELEKFFQLKKDSVYQAKDIELRETQIREKFIHNNQYDVRFKRNMIEFLEKAKNILIYAKCPPSKQPTSVTNNYQLDTTLFPNSQNPPPYSRESEISTRPDTQFIYSQNSDYLPGTSNPLKTRIITKCLNIDTRFRENYYITKSSDFVIQLPIKFSKVVSMQLASFEIPVSFYGISQSYGNNFFWINISYTEIVDGVTSEVKTTLPRIVKIPDGNYTGFDFIEVLNHNMSPPISSTSNGNNVTAKLPDPNDIVSFVQFTLDVDPSNDSGSAKVTIAPIALSVNNPNGFTVTNVVLDFSRDINGNTDNVDLYTKIGWNIGFTKKIYESSISYTAETIIEPANIRYFFLAVDDYNNNVNNHFVSVFNNSIFNTDILARISIRGTYFSLLMENDLNIVTEPRTYFGPVDIQRLRIRLYDDLGRILDLNNSNFSFCLNLKMLYDL